MALNDSGLFSAERLDQDWSFGGATSLKGDEIERGRNILSTFFYDSTLSTLGHLRGSHQIQDARGVERGGS